MQFYSTKDRNLTASFEEALLSGMASDGGLFMPEDIPAFTTEEIENLKSKPLAEVAFAIAKQFVGDEIPAEKLKAICDDAYNFEVPFYEFEKNHVVLELFHGPTQAFKDFAARFMARCTSYFLEQNNVQKNILVATSGDTGGAVGNGFLGLPGINVFILYPSGAVSHVQEQQLTTMGQNIRAIEVDGDFDACQKFVKEAFADREFNDRFNLMSANSINVGRVIPQSFYYFWSSLQLQQEYPDKKIVYSIPSGNFGNLFGGIIARQMGAPIHKFVASNNNNKPFFQFLKTGTFTPVSSVRTLSNAMDIGHPNNYYRIAHLFENNIEKIREVIEGETFDDKQTAQTIKTVFDAKNYIMCPHTAVAYLGAKKFQSDDRIMVTVSTADPAKFLDDVEAIIQSKVPLSPALKSVLELPKKAFLMKPDIKSLEAYLEDQI